MQATHSHWITASGQEGYIGAVDARFPYWSFTKTVISMCALKLVEDGALDLDGKLVDKPYSLRQLLAHTSGLPDYGQFSEYHTAVAANQNPWSRKRLLETALAKGMLFEPGQGWAYSNIGYMFVRELIEATAAQPLGDLISDIVCKPLGLASVELAETREQFGRVHWDGAATYDPRWVYHGCLTGNASDAARLLHALFVGNFLKPDTLDQMLTAKPLGGSLTGRPWTRHGYALGLMAGDVGGAKKAIGHSGAGPICVNAVYHFPDVSNPITVASFTDGTDEGVAEFATANIANSQ